MNRRVAATGNFMEVAFSSANDGSWGTGESFASNGAHSRGGLSEALLSGRDAAALARDAACWKGYVEIYSQCDLAERDC